MKVLQSPSPNFGDSTYPKIGIQLHKTLGIMPSALNWLRNPWSNVSAHYLVTREGVIHQLVQLDKRSWSSGRISRPSERALKIMLKTRWGAWVKPARYLIQIEAECFRDENYSEKQYESIVWLCQSFPFGVNEQNLITHQDTASYKPNLEIERTEILRRLSEENDVDDRLVLDNWSQLKIKVEGNKIILYK